MATLIVLAYNEEKNLESTLSEVSNNFDEVIIANDGSKDKTQEILNKLEKQYKNLKIINNKKKKGAGKSFQIAINEFLNSDSEYFIKISCRINNAIFLDYCIFKNCFQSLPNSIACFVYPIRL